MEIKGDQKNSQQRPNQDQATSFKHILDQTKGKEEAHIHRQGVKPAYIEHDHPRGSAETARQEKGQSIRGRR
jgi:hypothetical protein